MENKAHIDWMGRVNKYEQVSGRSGVGRRTGAKLRYDATDCGSLDAVDNVIARARYKVAISEYLYIGLDMIYFLSIGTFLRENYEKTVKVPLTLPENSLQRFSYWSSLSQATILVIDETHGQLVERVGSDLKSQLSVRAQQCRL